jgi:hypothetical protein
MRDNADEYAPLRPRELRILSRKLRGFWRWERIPAEKTQEMRKGSQTARGRPEASRTLLYHARESVRLL